MLHIAHEGHSHAQRTGLMIHRDFEPMHTLPGEPGVYMAVTSKASRKFLTIMNDANGNFPPN